MLPAGKLPLQPEVPPARPFIKWVGGKTQLLAQFAPLFPTMQPAAYYEPFVGSAAVFFHLQARRFARRYCLFDVNPELINVYRVVRDDLAALISLLADHKKKHTQDGKAHFYAIRALDRDPAWLSDASPVERAARMIYLNKTCYNGLWRVNSKGQFNAPLGRYANPPILDEEKLWQASAALQGVTLATRDFRTLAADAEPGDFVYFDPPYVPLTTTANFTSYAQGDFGLDDQKALAEVFHRLDARGCRLMLSNSDTALVRDLYAGFRIETVQARRAINSKTQKRGPVTEIVVLNY